MYLYINIDPDFHNAIFRILKPKCWNIKKNWALYIFTYNKSSLILSILSYTAQNFTLQLMVMQQTGIVLDVMSFTISGLSTV